MEGGKKRILLVHADRSILRSFESILEMDGYSVDTAETATEATEKSRTASYDFGLLDIELLYTESAKLQTNMLKGNPNARTIVLGAKPVDPRKLLEIMREELSLRRAEKGNRGPL